MQETRGAEIQELQNGAERERSSAVAACDTPTHVSPRLPYPGVWTFAENLSVDEVASLTHRARKV